MWALGYFGAYMRYILILIVFMLSACGSTGVVRTDAETFMIARRSAQVGFGPPVQARADVYREASEFCSMEVKQ